MFSSSSVHHTRWKRPIVVHKNSFTPPPSVSFVVAEPQQSRSPSFAADNLPSILRRAMPNNPSRTNTTPETFEDHAHDQSSTAGGPPTEPPVVHEPDQSSDPPPAAPLHAPNQAFVTPHIDQPSPGSPTDPSDTTCSQHPVLVHSLSNKRSWFNLLSWSNRTETSIAEVKVEVDSTPDASDAIHVCTESSESRLQSDSLETATLPASTTAAGDPSLSADVPSTPKDTVSRISYPISAVPKSDRTDVPSAHEEQLVSSLPSGLLPHHSPVSQTQEGVNPPVVSNSAKSIFPFNFPLLGRPKLPTETAITPSPQDPPAKALYEPSNGTSGPGDNRDDTSSMNSCVAHVSEFGDQSPSQPTAVTEVHTNIWWAYLGWSGSSSAIQSDLGAPKNTRALPGVHTSSPASDLPPIVERTESPPAESEIEAQVHLSSAISSTDHSPSDDKKSPSIQDVNPAVSAQGSAWHAPWLWYQSSSSSATTTVSPDICSGSQQDPPEQSQGGTKADEKQAADYSEVRPPFDQVSPLPQNSPATKPVDYGNPIQSVISANPAGWMSFFTAKAIAMKSITQGQEDGKMEVMEIDEEMVPQPDSTSPSSPVVTRPSAAQVTKPPIRAQSQASGILPSSSPVPRKLDDKDKRSLVSQAATNPETAVNGVTLKRQPSPTPSKRSGVKAPASPPPPNLVLPTWNDTFYTLPRSARPREPPSALSKTLQYVSGVLFSRDEAPSGKGKGKEAIYSPYDRALPRTWDVLGGKAVDVLKGCKKVVVIGVHGWFPGAVLRTFAGEPTGTSSRFVNGIVDALDVFQDEHKVKLDKVTKIPLEGEGTINRRVERLYQNLIGNKDWMEDLHDADAIFVAAHSQGSVVSTHLLDRLIADGHIRTASNADASTPASGVASGSVSFVRPPQRICCLALCGIHLGPLRYLSTSSLVQPYIQYFESTAARELFEFQNSESAISRDYVRALRNVLNNGVKMVYTASLTDQVVGLYSGLFTSVSHPLILRALYIDGDAYHPSDFLCNLLVLLLRIRNAGLSDGGLLTHLSEITAGSLNGIGHSTPYEERATYSLAINYLFLTDGGSGTPVELVEEPFNALAERNDYEIPWALRDLVADARVTGLFADDIVALRDAFRHWHPKTTILRDVKRKLQPIQRLSPSTWTSSHSRL